MTENNIEQTHTARWRYWALYAILAVVILWFFLRNLRLVTVIAISIPASVYTAFNFFYAFDISINSLTLVGIALAVGMLVDNSVVVLENIYRLAGSGKDFETSVKQGTKEVWRAIFASTMTTVVIFLPFLFTSNFLVEIIVKESTDVVTAEAESHLSKVVCSE